MTLPNFLIVGAAKCGTTSLFNYLNQHPEIGMPATKSANYFVWHRNRVGSLAEYEKFFDGMEGCKAVGEAPVRCLYDIEAPERIKRDLPDVKIIIMLRNPAEAAYSLWGHLVRNGEKLSFRAALKKEPERMSSPEFRMSSNNWHADYYYFSRYLYYDQVKRYIDAFGREKVRVLLFDDFKKDPVTTCREIFLFLGVDTEFVPEIERHNTGRIFRHRGLHKLLTKPPAWLSRVSSILPGGLATGIRETLIRFNTLPVPRIDDRTKRELLDRYRPDIERLAALLGRDLSAWH